MSQENVEALRSDFGAGVDAQDGLALDRAIETFHPDIEFREDPSFPEAGIYRGREAVRAYAEQFSAEFDAFSWQPEDFLDAGDDQVLVLMRVRGRGKSSGIEIDLRGGWLYTLKDGVAVRVDAYLDREEALAAAGLSE